MPEAREFITKAIEELQEAQAMRGERRPTRPTSVAAALDEGDGLLICIDIPGLNGAASQDLFWPSRISRSGGYPCNHDCMPFGLVNVGTMYQPLVRALHESHEVRRLAVASQEAPHPRELPEPPKTSDS